MPSPMFYPDESELSIRVLDEEVGHHHVLTRAGPDVTDTKILGVKSRSSFLPATSISSENASPFEFFNRQHAAAESVATTSSLTSSDSDADAIELSTLRSVERTTVRNQSFVSTTAWHGGFESTASAFTTASSSSSSECNEESRVRAAVWTGLEQADCPSAYNSHNAYAEDYYTTQPAPYLVDGTSDQSARSSPPMSPRETRYPHRAYVPSSSHLDDDPKRNGELSDDDLDSSSLCLSASQSPVDTHLSAAETDALLPIRTNTCKDALPLPVTTARCSEPVPFRFSFSHLETNFHAFGILVTTFLVIFSVWLTLANVKM